MGPSYQSEIAIVTTSLCERCGHMREVISGKGSRFVLCQKSATDERHPKYPVQPVMQCTGFERKERKREPI